MFGGASFHVTHLGLRCHTKDFASTTEKLHLPMPPKSKKQREVVLDERFQAIVLTDSFETRFMPLTSVKPRCLLPLVSVPLIEYTLEFLARAGVNEVYLMCSSHADQIQQYIENSKWALHSPFKVTTIMSLESRSVGDAMRDLDNRGLITGDFLLVSGDVVTNIDFEKVLAFHKQRKLVDKEHIVSMVLTSASPLHRTRSHVDPSVFILDNQSNRCYYYQDIPPAGGKKSSINIDPELLEDIENDFVVRNDLIDCHVDICSPHVPQIFQENFDYQTLRSDFVKGVLTSDLLKKTIYAYIAEGAEYAARVESWDTHDAISQDVLARWSYPLVPDMNLIGLSYKYEFNHIYKEDKVVLAQSCRVGNSTSIGANTSVGAHTAIEKSSIGRNCQIGANVTISNSYIWDNAVIGDGATINNAIVASESTIKHGAEIRKGVVIGYNVTVGAGKVISANTRLVDKPVQKEFGSSAFELDNEDDDSHEDDIAGNANDADIVGEDGEGVMYMSDRELDDESELESASLNNSSLIYQMSYLNVSDDSIASITKKKIKRHARHNSRSSRRMSATSILSTDYEFEEEEQEDFNKEAVATVERAMENNHDLDTALLELNTLRMSMNVTYHEVRQATVLAMVKRIVHFVSTDTLNVKEAAAKIFNDWGALFKRQVFTQEEQQDLAQIIQETCANVDQEYNQVVLFIALRQLYEKDIIEEDNILKWWESEASSESEVLRQVRGLTAQFVEWLQDAEEESEEESD